LAGLGRGSTFRLEGFIRAFSVVRNPGNVLKFYIKIL